jgi:hypothetical protein
MVPQSSTEQSIQRQLFWVKLQQFYHPLTHLPTPLPTTACSGLAGWTSLSLQHFLLIHQSVLILFTFKEKSSGDLGFVEISKKS